MSVLGRIAVPRPALPGLSFLSLLGFATRRLRAHVFLALLLGFGLLVASALVTCVPLFSDAVITTSLRETLGTHDVGKLPPASLLFRHASGRLGEPLSATDVQRIDRFLIDRSGALLPIPLSQRVRVGQTDQLSLFVGSADSPRDSGEFGFFCYLSDLSAHADLAEGHWPKASGTGQAIEAAMLTEGVDTLGIHVGDEIWVRSGQGSQSNLIPVKVVGRWNPRDSADGYWFNQPSTYALGLVVPEETLLGRVSDAVPRGGRQYSWYFELDPQSVRAADAGRLASGIAELRIESQRLWRGLRLDAAPDDLLDRYQRQTVLLEGLLLALGAPLVLIALQFVTMAADMRVEQQRGEVATLKSRGASTVQVLGTYVLEGVILGALASAAGPPLGAMLALGVGRSGGFFGAVDGRILPVAISRDAFVYAVVASALALGAALLPAAAAARTSVVTFRQESARALRAPLWRRVYLDLLPLPVAAYAYSLLQQRQSVVPVGAAGDALPDPLLLLAPAIFILAVTLAFVRFLPLFIRVAEGMLRFVVGPALLLALRQLSRQPGDYRGLILILTMTLAIGVFSASAASTIDVNQANLTAYQVGADLRLDETGAFDEETGAWTLLPVGEYRKAPGVSGAARVARLTGQQSLGGRAGDVQILALNPADFLPVTTWRDDYADQSLVDLMSALASGPTALIDRRMAESLHLSIGDELPLTIKNRPVEVAVVGYLDYFPTLSPDNGPFLIMNLDQLFDEVGPMPSEVWLQLDPGASDAAVVAELDQLGLPVTHVESLHAQLVAKQSDVGRQGTFGMLAVGFLIGSGLSVLSFLVYSYLSFRRRLIQIGILRAIGLGESQVVRLVLSEQLILIAAGVSAGLALGLVASWLYVPFLQVRTVPSGPPTVVLTAWNQIEQLLAIVGGGLLLVIPTNLLLLRQVRLHEAIKLGEEV